MPIALLALAIGGFGIGLTEFVIMGLLPEVAADFRVTEAAAGWLISGYALSVAVGAMRLTAAVTRFNRKHVLLGLMVLFIVGNLVSALAPDYAVMMIGRIIAALAHGAFFGIGAVVAASLVAPTKQAGAIAIMFTGLTGRQRAGRAVRHLARPGSRLALHVLGDHRHRRGGPGRHPHPGPEDAVRGPGPAACAASSAPSASGQVWLSILVTVLGFGGMFGAFTYIAYTLTEVSGFAASTVPWLLILFGVGLFVGNIVGRQGRRPERRTAPCSWRSSVLVVVLAVFALTAGNQPHDHRLPGADGRLRLRHRARAADAGHEVRHDGAHAGLRRQHRRLQCGQRPWRLDGRRDHHRRAGLHLAHLGRRRHHTAGPGRHGVRGGRGKAARRRPRRRLPGPTSRCGFRAGERSSSGPSGPAAVSDINDDDGGLSGPPSPSYAGSVRAR